MEREVMAEGVLEPKKRLALETDWTSAVGMTFLLILFLILAVRAALRIVHGPWTLEPITWQTWVLVGVSAWIFFRARAVGDRSMLFIGVLVAIGPVSRILLRLSHAAIGTELVNASFVRVINGLLYVGGCLFLLWWFKSKVRYV
jgi:hypothetical protein